MGKRHFEYKDEKSNKFWEIEVIKNKHEITYGKIGTDGREITKEFDDEETAAKEAEKLVKSKLKKGYVET